MLHVYNQMQSDEIYIMEHVNTLRYGSLLKSRDKLLFNLYMSRTSY